mmetsp:Transcript_48151/g.111534  ORF Transcript_48151/g.111534 Transcript_48151/m.111534 type:complete len:346 (-) Transcript_48151:257-1294(-)
MANVNCPVPANGGVPEGVRQAYVGPVLVAEGRTVPIRQLVLPKERPCDSVQCNNLLLLDRALPVPNPELWTRNVRVLADSNDHAEVATGELAHNSRIVGHVAYIRAPEAGAGGEVKGSDDAMTPLHPAVRALVPCGVDDAIGADDCAPRGERPEPWRGDSPDLLARRKSHLEDRALGIRKDRHAVLDGRQGVVDIRNGGDEVPHQSAVCGIQSCEDPVVLARRQRAGRDHNALNCGDCPCVTSRSRKSLGLPDFPACVHVHSDGLPFVSAHKQPPGHECSDVRDLSSWPSVVLPDLLPLRCELVHVATRDSGQIDVLAVVDERRSSHKALVVRVPHLVQLQVRLS